MNGNRAKSSAESRHRAALIVWGAQFMSLLMFFVLARVVVGEPRADGDYNRTLLLALAAAGLTTFALSFVLKAKLLSQAAARQRPELATSAHIIAFALCEATALFGLVAYFVTRAQESFYFFIPAALGLALHFPRRASFEDAPRGATFGEGA